jgi:hypothetical protein
MGIKFKRIKFNKSLLGTDVQIITKSSAKQWGFKLNAIYKGKLKQKVDWMVGCPVFECETGTLGLDYDCELIQEIKNEASL